MTLGAQLKRQRSRLKYTQETVAQKIKITRSTLSNWETDKTVPDIINLLKLCTFYGTSIEQLLIEEMTVLNKVFKTSSYGGIPLKIDSGKNKFLPTKGTTVEVKANVNMETGEVKLFVEQKDLEKLK